MKKLSVLTILIFVLLLSSCDKISHPIQSTSQQPGADTTTYVRKVLLEDYTGHDCGNCPAAARVAEGQVEKYPGKIIVIAVHAGWFARYTSEYVTSFTCTAGNDWDGTAGFGVSAIGNPNGMVNRKNYNNNGLIQKETKWPTTVSLALNDAYILGLKLKTTFNTSTRSLNTNVKANFKTAYANSVKLSVVLIEDSIIDAQKDYAVNPDHIPNYVFMHMLRTSINGSWGTVLKNTPIAAKDSVSVDFNNFIIDTKFKEKNLAVVAFAYDATTREVLQVEKIAVLSSSTARLR